jgi:O-antigen/teichoic acid export membrane protein
LSRVFAQGSGDRAALATYTRVFAPFVVVTAVYGALEAATRGFGTMVPSVSVERIGRSVAQPLAVGIAVALGGDALGVGVAYAAPYLAGALVLTWWLRRLARDTRRQAGRNARRDAADGDDRFWSFTAPRALSSIFQIALLWLDVLLVGALASSTEAGIYAAATRYLLMGTMAGQALTTAIQPQVSALLARGANRRAGDLFQIAAAWTMVVSWPIFLTVMVFARSLLDVLGTGFSQADTALVILGAAWVFASACGPIDVLLLMAGASRWNLANNAVAVAANVVLNLVLVPRWGITGAAIAWAVSIVITNGAPAIEVWYLLRIHPFGRGSAAVAAASVGLLAGELAVRAVLGTSLGALAAGGAAGLALYVALLARRPTVLEPHALRAAFRRVAPAAR